MPVLIDIAKVAGVEELLIIEVRVVIQLVISAHNRAALDANLPLLPRG